MTGAAYKDDVPIYIKITDKMIIDYQNVLLMLTDTHTFFILQAKKIVNIITDWLFFKLRGGLSQFATKSHGILHLNF